MKYKKILLCTIIATGLVLSVGCTKEVENNKTSTETAVDVSEKKSEASYDIVKKSIKNDYVEVYYPQIENMAGELIMDYINQDLENALKNHIKEATELKSKLVIDYEVTYKGEDILSIVFKGTQKHEGGEYKILYAINFDLKTSNKIFAKNLIKPDESAKNAINELLKEAAKDNKTMKHEFTGFGDWMGVYFTDDALVFYYLEDDMSTDYVKLSISRDEAKPYLNTEFGERPAS
ncbi:DUF4163 domain-containing protein [Crassaminicella thermophila]|uniref:DUF4163 domain-containing protein n=1 Tax=Crassaminicella thermophila TaxID=2599308 RepID=A0A5C0SEY5_CRATE|nr:DUF4163 domain-containing protein [Crassaminicella thermophila]QEK12901.1 DUF4163 domain-containing protein [Crassaminicella thermophila]